MAIRKIIKRATDALFTNTEFDGTEATRMVKGTTGERASAEAGDLRFNTTTSLMEYYDGVQWKSIDAPPVVSSISPTVESDANANIVITGSNFQSGATVKFVGNDGTEYASPTVTINSATQITATTPSTALSVANEPYDVMVTNVSGLSGTLADGLDAGGVPAFNESAGSLGSVYDSARTGLSFDAGATDPDGDTITYSVSAGSLPSGLSLNTSTGEISGTADAVGSQTISTFTISAATASDTSTRQFTITINAPLVTSYTSTGSGTFSVPSGVSTVDVLVVAGGGAGGVDNGGGGGAGGLIYRPAFPVTPGGSVSYTVGAGGSGYSGPISSYPGSSQGNDSIFGTLTAKGGGRAGSWGANGNPIGTRGTAGGSGGGGARYSQYPGYPSVYDGQGGGGTQPSQPGDSGTYGFGNAGGDAQVPTADGGAGAGGGGSGAGGQNSTPSGCGNGGQGKAYSISGSSVTYAGGGGGGSQGRTASSPQPGGGGWCSGTNGEPGQANRGGGGGAGTGGGSETSGTGGSGVIIVSY